MAAGPTARDRLLASAERLFAEHGYDGVSMRQIAADADSKLALIHYHFGSKLDLYRSIWTARYAALVRDVRVGKFEALDVALPQEAAVEAIVRLFWEPLVLTANSSVLRDFWVIGAREFVDPHEAERGIVAEFLDPQARRFIEAFCNALPHLSRHEIASGFQAMTGVFTMYVADRNRIFRLSDGAVTKRNKTESIERHIEYCIGGWLRLAQERRPHVNERRKASPRRPAPKTRDSSDAKSAGDED